MGAGDFVGEMGLLTDQPRSADVISLDYSKFLKLTRGDFNEILRRYPDIRAQVVDLAARRDQMNREPTVVSKVPSPPLSGERARVRGNDCSRHATRMKREPRSGQGPSPPPGGERLG